MGSDNKNHAFQSILLTLEPLLHQLIWVAKDYRLHEIVLYFYFTPLSLNKNIRKFE